MLVLAALVLGVPVSHVAAQTAPSGVAVPAAAPVAQDQNQEPEADLGPSNEALSPEEAAEAAQPVDLSPSDVTGFPSDNPNGVSQPISSEPEGGEGP